MSAVAWDQLAVGVAAVVGLVYVARTMRRLIADVLEFLGNHLSRLQRAQEGVVRALDGVADRLERLEERFDARR